MSRPSRRKTSEIEDNLQYVEAIIIPIDAHGKMNLQGKILHHLCTTTNASYETLTKGIARNRITILQSIETLIRYRYVEKQSDNPEREKSKLTFLPTLKGVACLWRSFPFDLKKMIKIKEENEITTYLEFVKHVFKFEHQGPMLNQLFYKIEYNYMRLKREDVERKKLIKQSFIVGILELAQRRDYSATDLFKERGIQWLTKTFLREELNEIKEFFVRTKQNLTTIIERFPVE